MPRSLARDHGEKRAALLANAAGIFARDGYDRASMAAVAAGSGVSKALLYHYYASKEALLADIIRNHLEMLVETVEAADDRRAAPRDRLAGLVAALLEAYRDADAEHRVQIETLRYLPETEQAELKALERRLVAIFAEAIAALPGFDARATPLKPLTMSLFGMLNWFYMWHRPDGPMSREEYGRLATRLVLAGVGGADGE